MDDLRLALQTLAPDDRRDLAQFMQWQRRRPAGRQDLRLLELLLSPRDYSSAQLIGKLYPDEPNPVAYYALRKRLMRGLMDFLLLRQRQHDATAATSVRGLLSLAQYLFAAGVPRLAWATLRQAEKLGLANEQFEPLNAVYSEQVQQAHLPEADEPLADILRRRQRNKKFADEEERAGLADAVLRERLRGAKRHGRGHLRADELLQDVLKEYDLQEAFARSPALLYRLMSLARNAMLLRGDYTDFAPYLERCYRLMERRHGFRPAQRQYQLRLLYLLAHALYRAKRFADSVGYAEQGLALLAAAPARQFADLRARFTFLLAADLAFLGRNADSIQLLQGYLTKPAAPLSLADELTARLQLTFHYFAQADFARASQSLISLDRTDHWLEENLGLEWRLKHNMGEMLIQLELGHADLALTRLRAVRARLLEAHQAAATAAGTPDAPPETGPYHAVLRFLEFVRDIIRDPAVARTPEFAQRVAHIPAFLSEEKEDLQVVSFFAWLKARVLGRPYYEVLMQLAKE